MTIDEQANAIVLNTIRDQVESLEYDDFDDEVKEQIRAMYATFTYLIETNQWPDLVDR